MKKSVEIILNICIWIILIFLIYKFWEWSLALGRQSPHGLKYPGWSFIISLIQVLSGFLTTFYFFYFFITPNIRLNKRLVLIGQSVLFCIVSATFMSLITKIDVSSLPVGGTFDFDFKQIHLSIILVFIFGIMGGLLKGAILWYNSINEKRMLEKKHLESKTALLLLKAQLNPHFLFNSLNNIDILIEETPKIASEYLKKLSDILRYVLYETKEDETELVKEIEQIKSYIELQKIRTDNPQFVSFRVSGELETQRIAPMIFLPFIENAFKYCKNKSIDHAIDIEFEIHNNMVRMVCKNYFESNQLEIIKDEGLGIETIKQRLNLLYPSKHDLHIDKTEHWFKVTLNINLLSGN